jgi:twitching motility protein PilT
MHIDDLLRIAVERGASDLHLKVGSFPMLRVHGSLVPAVTDRILLPTDTAEMAARILPEGSRDQYRKAHEVDFAYRIDGLSRFRCNVFQQRGTVSLVLRVIPPGIPPFDDLLLPPIIKTIAQEERGLVLVTGVSGSGKSTTIAAMVQHINEIRAASIVTIEDPIEYLHRDKSSLIAQREVTVDTQTFAHALRASLRQDPDVIMVGEMRDQETIETALTAAETGHLVLSTLHTLDARETVNRIVSVFPPFQHRQIRMQLAAVLRAVVSQRLMPRSDIVGRCPALEVMIATPFIRDCIIEPERTMLIQEAIAAGTSQYGMQTFDQSIYEHYQAGRVSYDEALRWASRVDEFKMRVQGIGVSSEANEFVRGNQPIDGADVIRFDK